jgi:hypothetical protein
MAIHRRAATFDAVLVYLDEPQLITLVSQKTRIVAVAIPYDNQDKSMFLATTVAPGDWQKYLDGSVDLRYLFTYPKVRVLYHFDLHTLNDNRLMMTPWDGDLPEDYLPMPRFFSSNHTEEYDHEQRATDTEVLVVDGEWELTDFGQFQQKYADIYAFLVSTINWGNASASVDLRSRIKQAFLHRPFAGGFSYVHLFNDLAMNVPRSDQLNLNKIRYASPGKVEMTGKDEVFDQIQTIIPNFLHKRDELHLQYRVLHKFLSDKDLLRLNGDQYGNDPTSAFVTGRARQLAVDMLAPDFGSVWDLTNKNPLVAAKVVLSFYRRLNDAAAYFAQGRVSYS